MKNNIKKLSDEALTKVTGGTAIIINGQYNILVRSGPGNSYNPVYSVNSGDMVFTQGMSLHNEIDGIDWEQLDDGNWIPKGALV